MKKQVSPKITIITFSVLILLFLTAFYISAWVAPSVAPPGDNVDTSINTGGDNQTKNARISATEFGDANDPFWYIDLLLGSAGTERIGFFTDSGTEKVSILANGNVGIGKGNPQAALEVNGDVKINSGGSANKVVCWKADGSTLGYCSNQPNVTGSCTCN